MKLTILSSKSKLFTNKKYLMINPLRFKNWLWEKWMWYKNPKCKECNGDGLVHFDGEDLWLDCEHCEGKGYVDNGGRPFGFNAAD